MRMTPLGLLSDLVPPLLTRALAGLSRIVTDAIARLRLAPYKRLHLACGSNIMTGWANVDLVGPPKVIRLDLTRALPIVSASVSFIYSEHFIEHIPRHAVACLVRECHRVLEAGGVLRLSTPDLKELIAQYHAGRLDYWGDMDWKPASPAQLINQGMRLWGHQFVFDQAELEAVVREAGFSKIEPRAWRESPHEALTALECRAFHGELIYECTK